MPVDTSSAPPRQIVFLIVATIVGVAAMVFLFTRTAELAQSGDVQLNIGDDVFGPGNVERLADDIEGQDTPLLFSDPAGRDRDIWLQHIGDDPDTGWYAFAVRPVEAPRDCFVNWVAEDQVFDYNCGDLTFPADGEGLFQYDVLIAADGEITIDLNAADRDARDRSSTTIDS